MPVAAELVTRLTAEQQPLVRGMDESTRAVERGAGRMRGALSGVRSSFRGVGRQLISGLGTVGIGILFAKGIRDSIEFAKVQSNLEAVLKATGNAAGFTADELIAHAKAMQAATTFGDQAIVQATSMLASFREIKGDIFKDTLEAVLDISTVMQQDVRSSVVQLGKALNDPLRGMTALQRVGVAFSDSQKEQVKNFIEQNRLMDAQRVILRELQQEFGGAARAMAKTDAGKLIQQANALSDAWREMTKSATPSLAAMAQGASNTFTYLNQIAAELKLIRGAEFSDLSPAEKEAMIAQGHTRDAIYHERGMRAPGDLTPEQETAWLRVSNRQLRGTARATGAAKPRLFTPEDFDIGRGPNAAAAARMNEELMASFGAKAGAAAGRSLGELSKSIDIMKGEDLWARALSSIELEKDKTSTVALDDVDSDALRRTAKNLDEINERGRTRAPGTVLG